MKSTFVRIAAVMCITLNSVASGASTTMPAPGTYDAQIIKSSMCALKQDDRRICHRLKVKFPTGKIIDTQLWDGVTIYDARGRYIYKVNYDNDTVEMWERFSKGISYLTVGMLVRMKISCSRASCDVGTIQIR